MFPAQVAFHALELSAAGHAGDGVGLDGRASGHDRNSLRGRFGLGRTGQGRVDRADQARKIGGGETIVSRECRYNPGRRPCEVAGHRILRLKVNRNYAVAASNARASFKIKLTGTSLCGWSRI